MKLLTSLSVIALPLAVIVTACSNAPPEEAPAPDPVVAMVEGDCADVFGGSMCTWAETEDGQVVRLGANVPLASIENAPADMEFVWPPVLNALLPLPAVATEQLGVHDLKIYWEAHGHPPGPYLTPHWDFHFFTISAEETNAIDCSDLSKPETSAEGYTLPDIEIPGVGMLIGLCVPAMGMHALLISEMESEDIFDGTMVVGYYENKSVFYEPMITRDLLMEQQTFSLPMPAFEAAEGVVLPTRFEAVYDAENSSYDFVFSGFSGGEL